MRFRDRVSELCDAHPDAPAIEFEQRWTSWGDVARRRAALDVVLQDAGVGDDDPVGIVVRERPPAVTALLALLARRGTVVLVQSLASDVELCADVARLPLAAVVAEQRDWDRPGFAACVAEAGVVGVALGDAPGDVAADPRTAPTPRDHPVGTSDVAVLVPTSGTSGPPRRHAVSDATLDAAGGGVVVRAPADARGATIGAVPLSSIGGLMALVSTVWRGRPIALMERFDVDQWAALVREHRPRRIGVPPAVIGDIVERELPREWFDGVECLTTGSAPLDVDAARRFADRYGIPVLNAYGATELGGPVVAWRDDDWAPWHATKLGSVGRALPGVELRVEPGDGDGDGDGDDGVGVLAVRKHGGPWTRTSDLARIDADGFVWIEGRADDVIVRGGFKVRAADVERALTEHPAVAEAVVVGIPDARLGAVPGAMVTLVGDAARVTGDELRDHVRTRVAPYKVPVLVRIVDEIPRNAMMKPRRAHIRDILGGDR